MRILRPITTALACAILALANACGGTQTGNLDGSPQGDQQRIGSGFELRNAEAAPDSIDAAALRIETREENGHTVMDILSRRQLPSGSLLLELLYDSSQYSPLDISATEVLGRGSDALSIQQLERPGRLSFGRIPLGGQRDQIPADAVIARAMFANRPMQQQRRASDVPVHNNALSPLFWDEDSGELTWYYVNPGDYDQNGIVGLSDLVPLGIHFGKAGPFDFYRNTSIVDGNRDGVIGIADISAIGLYWGNSIDAYNVYSSDDIDNVPMGYSEESSIAPLATLTLADSLGDLSTDRRYWVYTPDNPGAGDIYWIRPESGGDEGLVSEGTRSNINGGGLGGNPDIGPDEEDFNFLPEARLSISFSGQNVPLSVTLDASASTDQDGSIIFYEWDYEGDGIFDGYSFDPVILRNYIQSGTYAPLVRVTDNSGGTDSFQSNPFEATVASISNILPVADITATAVSGTAPLTIGFIGSGSIDVDGVLSYEWDFDGDGTFDLDSGTDSTVLFSYPDPGTFTATLRVTDNASATATDSIEIVVNAPAANIPPVADVIASPSGGIAPLTVSFDGGGSSDTDGRIASHFWSWDDGSVPEGTGTDPSTSHTFSSPGSYDVQLTVIDDNGAQDSDMVTITVVPPGANVPPSADIIVLPASGVAPLRSIMDASGSNDPDGVISEYSWDFDEGAAPFSSGTDPTINHEFSNPGTYNVTVTVTDNDGGTDSDSFTVIVNSTPTNNPPVADVFAVPTGGDVPLTVAFSAAGSTDSDGQVVGYVWDWGDGSGTLDSGGDPTVSHTYTVSGVYDAILTVQDDDGATHSDSVQINVTNVVNEPPVADIHASIITGEAPLAVPFTGAGSIDPDGVITNYSFDWDDTTTTDNGADPSTSHTFTNPGTYSVEISVTDNNGATDTDSVTVNVLAGGGSNTAPDAQFSVNVNSFTSVPVTVTFDPSASSDSDGSVVRYDWDWEGNGLFDASAFSNAGVQHTYTVFEEYNPVLVVTDDDGATDSFTLAILPDIPPVANITTSPNPAGTGDTVTVDASGSTDFGGTITKYEFDLDGNGSFETDNGTNPVISTSFAVTGDYILRVRITDNDLNQDSDQVTQEIRDAQIINVTSAGSPGTRIKAAIIGGNPAIAYYDTAADDVMFIRATNSAGTSWGSPVTVAFTGDVGRNLHLVEANGRPAICYNNNSGGLYYQRAADASGTNWSEASQVQISTQSINDCEMEIISGNPAICFHESGTNILRYIRATDANGGSWGTLRTVNSGGTNSGSDLSLAVVNGNPAVAFFYWNGSAGIRYRYANDADGASWNSVVTIDSNASVNDSYDLPSLLTVNGNPAICYESRSNGNLVFKRASDSTGGSWGSRVTVAGSGDNSVSSLLYVGSLPFASYYEGNASQLRFAWGSNGTGSAWDATQLLDAAASSMDSIVVDNQPFIVYFNSGVKAGKLF